MILRHKNYGYLDMITLSFRTSPFYTILYTLKTMFDALLPTLSIFITADFVNSAIAVYNDNAKPSTAYAAAAILSAMMIYNSVNAALMSFVETRRAIYYRKRVAPEIIDIRGRLPFNYYENSNMFNMIYRACNGMDSNIWNMYSRFLNMLNLIIHLVGVMISLSIQVWWVAITMALMSVPLFWIAVKGGKKTYVLERELSINDRRTQYLSGVLKSRENVEERVVYGYADDLNYQYAEKLEYARKKRFRVNFNNYMKMKVGGIITTGYSVFAMLTLLPLVIHGEMTLGMFVGLMGGIFALAQRLSWGMNYEVIEINKLREYLKDITAFMDHEEDQEANALPVKGLNFEEIEFRNVRFKYPGMDKLVLNGISFKIKRGLHYSFVGVNGVGKTTLTKLLMGMYNEYEGEILIDGRELRIIPRSEVKGLSSVVFQDFLRFNLTMQENIAIGNITSEDMDLNGKRIEVEEAARLAGLGDVIEKLQDGIDTPLGKIFENSVDLSGGEWQRIAMARNIMSSAPLKILDEPTAALDPIGESMVYRNFEQIMKGKTTIFISHRLGSTKLADVIYVMEEGKVVEEGSHLELMKMEGKYADMYRSQAEWYIGENTEDGLKI